MQPQLFNLNGKNLNVIEKNGKVYFNAEQSAIGMGISQTKNGKLYARWERVHEYLHSPQVGKGDYITEPQFYELAIKANNQAARSFQHWVTNEVLPSIRKTGSYSIQRKPDSYMIDDPVKRAERWIEERKAYEALVPKGQYFDSQMRNPGTMTVTEIAKDYGMPAREFNQLLHKYGIQFKQGKHWVLYHKYDGKGYTQYEPFAYNDNKGVHNNLKWTQRGRKFIYDTLKEHGILPVLEQPELLPEVNAVD